LLHAASSSGRQTYAAQIPALADAFQLFLPDARGHGRTRWDAADGFEASWLVDDLEAFVDGLGLRTFHLIGYSMGAASELRPSNIQVQRTRPRASAFAPREWPFPQTAMGSLPRSF
jgi:pimeloyl-ACP methyl ester carboxylesterase